MHFRLAAMISASFLIGSLSAATAGPFDASTPMDASGHPAWVKGTAATAARLRALSQGQFQTRSGAGSQESLPPSLSQLLTSRNANGIAGTYMPPGSIPSTSVAPFFQPLGSNDRTCLTCHRPDSGWSITPSKIKALFQSQPAAPLFQPVDGAVCPNADTSTQQATTAAYALLINKGLIRVFIPMPSADTLQFAITAVTDPYDCTGSPVMGMTSPTSGIVSEYRRPLASANLPFLATIMWDGREPSLASQASDAVMIHAQGTSAPGQDLVDQMVQFESTLFASQVYDTNAGDLTSAGAQAGPAALSAVSFAPGANPPGPQFNPSVMTMFLGWLNNADDNKAAIARGEAVFNEKSFAITAVAGLNDTAGKPSIQGTCSACHNTAQVGGHSSPELLDLGVANAPDAQPAGTSLSVADLPVFSVHCTTGPLAGTDRQVTDLGRGLITGQCADIGKVKTAVLRNLSARPPYFHNGSAPDLATVVDFYDHRFSIGLTDQEKSDLIAFLSTL